MSYETRVTGLTVAPKGEPLFSECATKVYLDDDAAGEYVVVEQCGREGLGKILIGPEEWSELVNAIDRLIADCRKEPASDEAQE